MSFLEIGITEGGLDRVLDHGPLLRRKNGGDLEVEIGTENETKDDTGKEEVGLEIVTGTEEIVLKGTGIVTGNGILQSVQKYTRYFLASYDYK